MGNPLGRLLLGSGRLPDDLRARLRSEGPATLEEGLPGSVTYRHYRKPGYRTNRRRRKMCAALAITDERFGIYARGRPVLEIRFDDPHLDGITVEAAEPDLVIAFDASTLDPRASGQITVRIRCGQPDLAIEQVRARRSR